MLQKIFGPKSNQNTGEYKQRKNNEVMSMLEDSDIIATPISKRISWAEHNGKVEHRQSVKLPARSQRAKDLSAV